MWPRSRRTWPPWTWSESGIGAQDVGQHFRSSVVLHGGLEDSVEHIELQNPGQGFTAKRKGAPAAEDDEEIRDEYGSADPSVQLEHNLHCAGCGAKLHCADGALPGFVPIQLLARLVARERRGRQSTERCRRCFMLHRYDLLVSWRAWFNLPQLDVNVSPVDYRAVMGHLKLVQDALIILLVDMTDISGSIFKDLPQLIGRGKSVIVVGKW